MLDAFLEQLQLEIAYQMLKHNTITLKYKCMDSRLVP